MEEQVLYVREANNKGYAEAYEGDGVNFGASGSHTRRGRVGKGEVNTLTTQAEQGVVVPCAVDEQNKYLRQDGCVGTLTTDGSSPKHNNRVLEKDKATTNECTRKILQILREKVGDGTFTEWAKKVIGTIEKDDLLRQELHEESLPKDGGCNRQKQKECSHHIETDERTDITTERVPTMWLCEEFRCASQRWELEEQYDRELNGALQELSHKNTSTKIFLQSLWEASQGLGVLRKALHSFQKIWKPIDVLPQDNLRIRKLTPTETWRLQGFCQPLMDGNEYVRDENGNLIFDDSAIHKAMDAGVSNSQLYKQAGNAVSVNISEAIGIALAEWEKQD